LRQKVVSRHDCSSYPVHPVNPVKSASRSCPVRVNSRLIAYQSRAESAGVGQDDKLRLWIVQADPKYRVVTPTNAYYRLLTAQRGGGELVKPGSLKFGWSRVPRSDGQLSSQTWSWLVMASPPSLRYVAASQARSNLRPPFSPQLCKENRRAGLFLSKYGSFTNSIESRAPVNIMRA
jgi:hypothetical protein